MSDVASIKQPGLFGTVATLTQKGMNLLQTDLPSNPLGSEDGGRGRR